MSETFETVLARRTFLKGAAAGVTWLACPARGQAGSALGFSPILLLSQDAVIVADGYSAGVVIRWGDPLTADAPEFDVRNQTPEAQARQFGYNCDFLGFFPLPGADPNAAGLLAVNHETTVGAIMFENYVAANATRRQVDIEMAAMGLSIVEIRRGARGWEYVRGSAFNRRLTMETEMLLTGPAAGHELMKTSYDPSGRRVRGTLHNCAGGKTPWGTVLTAEENFHGFFANRNALPAGEVRSNHERYGVSTGASSRRWELHHDRFNVTREPNEPFRFGWIVEIDPYDPGFVPRKRTALGRTKHEGAATVLAPDGRLVVYSGDDQQFEYVYKFVTRDRYNPSRREANFDLLDDGVLFVARFLSDGSGIWVPLLYGFGPLVPANGFFSQADVLIQTRRAADFLGATRMDRPEDVEANPVNKKVYVSLTNNTQRTAAQIDLANPRANNRHGHILEVTEAGDNSAATRFRWEVFMLCGNPHNPADAPIYFAEFDPYQVSPISNPDKFAFDLQGNLWIATDGQPGAINGNDGLYAVPTEGPERGRVRQFLSAPMQGEVCGPEFTPDNTTLFCAIQHPGNGGALFTRAVSNWPDGAQPPKPSVLAVTKNPGAGSPVIGS